ncbi:MAG TPA: radical SAM protein [Bacilli bacterium]
MATHRWKPSKFNAFSRSGENENIVYNSYTGAIAALDDNEFALLSRETLKNADLTLHQATIAQLAELGFIVPAETDELKKAEQLHQSLHKYDLMHLVVMPTESCNFRCTYCYEHFARGKMSKQVVTNLADYVDKHARKFANLSLSWFGGEPLLAPDVIEELSERFLQAAETYGFNYYSDMATNGYFLTPELFRKLLKWRVTRYMITIDGTREIHDKRRKLSTGGGSYERIMENLLQIKELAGDFEIHLRMNFDHDNLALIPDALQQLGALFGGDKRFQLFARPVGKWGGPNDDELPVCDHHVAGQKIWDFQEFGQTQGIRMSSFIEEAMLPTGSVCYAAKPHSLVVGSDGTLYKCTIALEEDFNRVGKLKANGEADLDMDKITAWVTSGEEKDSVCQSCFYRPACQGNFCPLYRMRTGKRPCPEEKKQVRRVLQLYWKNQSV